MKQHSIGKTIALLRKKSGLTQNELAQKLQISDKAISKWEKDNGSPSIDFFPILAQIFNVSIDYLLTGKETEKDIIIMSKLELCAKDDDVNLFLSLPENIIEGKDENQKDIINYIYQYKSINVFNSLLQKYGVKALTTNYFDRYSLRFNNEDVIKLLLTFDKAEDLYKIGFFFYSKNAQGENISKYINFIVDNIDIDSAIIKKIIALYQNDTINPQKGWPLLYSNILKYASETDNKKYMQLFLPLIIKINKDAIEFNKTTHYDSYLPRIAEKVKVDTATIKGLLLNKYFNEADFLNTECLITPKDKLYDGEIQMLTKKANSKISEYEALVLPCVDKKIIDIDKLLLCDSLPVIQTALKEYAIHEVELLAKMLLQNDYRSLFEYSIDNKMENLSLACIKMNSNKNAYNEICRIIISMSNNKNNNYKYLNNINKLQNISIAKSNNIAHEILDFFAYIKDNIINELTSKLEKEKIVSILDKNYFESELKKDNLEMVIIKLCVRLEAILRANYHYQGTFEEMLSKYCACFNTTDDEEYNYDPETPRLLQKLRLQRNSIVHSEKIKESLTTKEIEHCIAHICNLK